MKKTTKNDKKMPAQHATYEYMMQTARRQRNGRWVQIPRIERLSWKRLAEIYNDERTTKDVKTLIEREARRCGYEPLAILNQNA